MSRQARELAHIYLIIIQLSYICGYSNVECIYFSLECSRNRFFCLIIIRHLFLEQIPNPSTQIEKGYLSIQDFGLLSGAALLLQAQTANVYHVLIKQSSTKAAQMLLLGIMKHVQESSYISSTLLPSPQVFLCLSV